MDNTKFSFPSALGKLEDPNFRGVSNWEFCSRMHFWGVRAIFLIFHNGQHQFSISINTWKTKTQTLRWLVIGSFALGCICWGVKAIFLIFYNGRHQFSLSIDTWKTRDLNFRGSVIWEFCSRMHFGELEPFF